MWLSILETLLYGQGRFDLAYAVITDQPVELARIQLVEYFLKHQEFDYLLFADADMMWGRDAIYTLLSADKDIITALTTERKQGQTRRAINYLRADNIITWVKDLPSETEPFEIDACGMAFALIKRKVLEVMGQNSFERITMEDGTKASEDLSYCIRAKQKGFQIWCHPQVKVGHIGKYVYTDADVRAHI